MRAVRGRLVRFHLDLDLGSFFEFHFVAILVGKIVGNANFAVEVIRALDANLRFFRFSGTGMWTNHLLYFAWKCSASLCLLRHELDTPELPAQGSAFTVMMKSGTAGGYIQYRTYFHVSAIRETP